MEEVWENYKKRINDIDKYEPFIWQYFRQIIDMAEDRYVCLLTENSILIEDSLNQQIQKNHLLEKEEINIYIKECEVNRLKKVNNIAIYGAGLLAKKIYILLQKNEISVSCFCVTNTMENPTRLFDKPEFLLLHANCNEEF